MHNHYTININFYFNLHFPLPQLTSKGVCESCATPCFHCPSCAIHLRATGSWDASLFGRQCHLLDLPKITPQIRQQFNQMLLYLISSSTEHPHEKNTADLKLKQANFYCFFEIDPRHFSTTYSVVFWLREERHTAFLSLRSDILHFDFKFYLYFGLMCFQENHRDCTILDLYL